MAPSDPRQTKFVLDEIPDPARLVQHRRRPAGPAVAAPPPGHRPADRAGRPGAAVPDGAHRPGGLGRARDRDPGAGPRRLPPVPAEPALSRAPARARARYAGPHLLQVRGREPGRQPQAEHGASPQAFYNKEEGVKRLATETGAGQWGSALAFAGALFGLEVKVYMVRASYDQKPYRRILMETYGAEVVASPSLTTNYGRTVLGETPDNPGSLGHRHQRSGRGRGDARRHEVLAGLRAQPRAPAPDRDRPGGDRADGHGRRVAGHHHRLHGRRLELRRPDVPVPRPQLPRGREAPGHRRRAGGGAEPDPRRLRLRLRRHRQAWRRS